LSTKAAALADRAVDGAVVAGEGLLAPLAARGGGQARHVGAGGEGQGVLTATGKTAKPRENGHPKVEA